MLKHLSSGVAIVSLVLAMLPAIVPLDRIFEPSFFSAGFSADAVVSVFPILAVMAAVVLYGFSQARDRDDRRDGNAPHR